MDAESPNLSPADLSMPGPALKLTVIIVNWNTGNLLAKCLESVRTALPGLPAEVLIVDNASTDGSELVVESGFPEFRLIRSDTNIGFARANNLAARQARGKYLLFLNPDTVAASNTFRTLLEFADRNPGAVVGCRVQLPNGRVQDDSCGHSLTPARWFGMRLRIDRVLPAASVYCSARLVSSARVDWVSGVCLLIAREAFMRLVGFDEAMFAYMEDMDLCLRARPLGISCWWLSETSITHFRGTSFGRAPFRQKLCMLESEARFVCRHWPSWAVRTWRLARKTQYTTLMMGGAFLPGRRRRELRVLLGRAMRASSRRSS
jgi:GT2 family glycosyltransferase